MTDADVLSGIVAELDARLAQADEDLARRYPGERPERQPVHTVYVPASRYDEHLVPRWGEQAQQAIDAHGGSASELAEVLALPAAVVDDVLARVREKLRREPIEDLRVDFEDGYGAPGDDVEDEDVDRAAAALAASVAAGTDPPFAGIRFKSLEAPTRHRGVRTLHRFLAGLAERGPLPSGFVVTLPKVTSVEQVEAMAVLCERLETHLGLDDGVLRFEIQVETPQAVLAADGTATVARMVHAAGVRCAGLHYGTYDYSAACGIAAAHQSMDHPAADHAKAVMQVAVAGTGVRLSDGSTNVLPVGERDDVHAGWRLHSRLVRRSLERGFYQGWDLHPAQLPSRFAAVYSFYREGLPAAAARLRSYLERTESSVLDEPATARALADFAVRGLDCGALDAAEVTELSGVDPAALDVLARRARR